MRDLKGQPMFYIRDKAAALESEGKKIYHMELGDPNFNSPVEAAKAAIRAIEANQTHYTSSWGLDSFRETITKKHINELGYECEKSNVVSLPGANSGIYFIIRVTTKPGDTVLIPDPGFPTYNSAALAADARVEHYSLKYDNNYQPDIKELSRQIKKGAKLLILNSPSNPIGQEIDKESLEEIYKLCKEEKTLILEDATYQRMYHQESEWGRNRKPNDKYLKNTCVIGSLSKEYSMSGFRLGYLAGPKDIIRQAQLYIETVNSCVPQFTQAAGEYALKNCDFERREIVKELDKRSEVFCKMLSMSPYIDIRRPVAGLYVFPKIKSREKESVKLAEVLLEKCGIASVPGTAFGYNGEGHLRFSLNQSYDDLIKVAKLIKEFVKEHQ